MVEMEICELSYKELKIIIFKKLSELPENVGRQPNETKEIICEHNENINKEKQTSKRTK